MGITINGAEAGQRSSPRPGRKLLHGVGLRRFIAGSGTPMLTLGFVVLQDGAGHGDEGRVHLERFALTESSAWKLNNWAAASGSRQAFDSDDDKAFKDLLAKGPVVAVLVEEEYNEKTRMVVEEWSPHSSKPTPEQVKRWAELIESGTASFRRIVDELEQKFGGGGSSGGSRAARSAPDDVPFNPADDDIPFLDCSTELRCLDYFLEQGVAPRMRLRF